MTSHSYSTIEVSGDDAFEFLQGQLTNDLRRLEDAPGPLLAAWCNPKGRVIVLLRVDRVGDSYTLTLPAGLAEAVARRLTLFRFRSKVEFTVREATADETSGQRSTGEWRLANLEAGIAEIDTRQSEEFTPHMLNLDRLDAVSLDKGCYTGQEIVARTHYRGASKRRMFRFRSAAAVQPGDRVLAGERAVGQVVNAIGNDILAVVPVDAAESGLTCDGHALVRKTLPYALADGE